MIGSCSEGPAERAAGAGATAPSSEKLHQLQPPPTRTHGDFYKPGVAGWILVTKATFTLQAKAHPIRLF